MNRQLYGAALQAISLVRPSPSLQFDLANPLTSALRCGADVFTLVETTPPSIMF